MKIQADIMQAWTDRNDDIMVSIVCAAYNHEKYISQAIEGFLMQETEFPFEIIIHDDASKDGTQEIIRGYQKKYPKLIRPIFQTENQYSKGNFKPSIHAASYAVGQYIALCEGDDYWIDSGKLARQVASLSENSEYNLCFHPALCFSDGKKNAYIINKYSDRKHIVPLEKFITGGGGFCPTASLMIRRNVFEEIPDWINKAPVGDYYLQVLGAKRGGGIYLPDVMSAYRYASSSSVSQKSRQYSLTDLEKTIVKDICCLDNLSKFLEEEYSVIVTKKKAAVCTEYSLNQLSQMNFKGFKKLIEQSWSIQRHISSIQTLCYAMRIFPLPLLLLLKIKRKFLPFQQF